MLSLIRSHRSALVLLAGFTCLAVLLLLAVVGLFLAAFPAAAQSAAPPGPDSDPAYKALRNVALSGEAVSIFFLEALKNKTRSTVVLPRSCISHRDCLLARSLSLRTARSRAEVQGKFPALEADTSE